MSKIKIYSNLFFLLALFFFGVNSANAAFCDLWFDPKDVNVGETSNLHWSVTGGISSASISCYGSIVNIEPVNVTEALQNESVGSIPWEAGTKAGYVRCDLDIEPANYGGCSTGDHGQNLNVNSSAQSVATVSPSVSPASVIPGQIAYITWTSQNATRMEVECSLPVEISRGGIETSSAEWEVAAAASGLYVKPDGAPDGYPAAFSAASSVPEVCTFYPYGSDGAVGVAQSVTITITDSCECLVNSPFSGGSSCAGGYCDGCHCVYSGTRIDGACGSANGQSFSVAPTANLCSTGTASVVSGSGPWTWNCIGSNGGTTASCVTKGNNSGSNCGTAANSNYACSATETSGTLCASGVTCYPNTGYPPSPCPENIALSGSSAHWYCGMDQNCYANKLSSCLAPTINPSGYKSANQVEQTYCAEYDEQGYCAETVSRDLGFKNLFPPEKVANGNESTVRQGFNACNMNGGDYCDYSNQELSQFKLYLVPEMKSASVTIYNSQNNSSNPIKFVAIARFGEPPTGDYSNIDPTSDTISPEACTIEGVTGKDCVVRNSDGITSVLNYNSGNQDLSESGWLYVKFIELENEFRNVQSLMTIDSAKYEAWYDNLTTTNQWQADGDPPETVNPVNASSGSCGTAMRTYAATETSWGSYTFCSTGTTDPTSPAFPAQDSSTTWKCKGVNGGADVSCTATRENSGSQNIEEDSCKPDDPNCASRTCKNRYCWNGCELIKGTSSDCD